MNKLTYALIIKVWRQTFFWWIFLNFFGFVIVMKAWDGFRLGIAVESFSSWACSCFSGFLLRENKGELYSSNYWLTFEWYTRQIMRQVSLRQSLALPKIVFARLVQTDLKINWVLIWYRLYYIAFVTQVLDSLTCNKHWDIPDSWRYNQKQKLHRHKHVLLLK